MEPEPFRIEVTGHSRLRIAPIGELDLATAEPFQDVLTELAAGDLKFLMIDLNRLSFMDCSGLRVLLKTQRQARQAGLSLSVVCGPGQVRRLLALSHTDHELDVLDSAGQQTPTTNAATS